MSARVGLSVERPTLQEVVVTGELDRSSTARFDDAVATAAAGAGTLVVDLSNVRFIDSSGVRSLIKLGLSMQGRELVLRDPSPTVMRVLRLTRLDEVGLWRIALGADRT